MTQPALASIELRVPETSRWGRAFFSADQLPFERVRLDEVARQLEHGFLEEDDHERFALLERALGQRYVIVETYPGMQPPEELHVYLRSSETSPDPIFACVLAPMAVVRELVSQPPHVVLETASFQVMGEEVTNAAIVSGLEAWAGRIWPGRRLPKVLLSPWPGPGPGPVESREAAIDDLLRLPLSESVGVELAGAQIAFGPPPDLVPPEFRSREKAA